MNKEEIYEYLTVQNVWYETAEHDAVYNMEELKAIELSYPEWDGKNLFVRDDKKRNYYLLTVKGDKRIDLKKFRKQHGLRSLSFASEDDLMDLIHKHGNEAEYVSFYAGEESEI